MDLPLTKRTPRSIITIHTTNLQITINRRADRTSTHSMRLPILMKTIDPYRVQRLVYNTVENKLVFEGLRFFVLYLVHIPNDRNRTLHMN